MKTKEFIDSVRELLLTDDEQFEFANPSATSIYLREFRSRHAGEWEGDVWTMLRGEGKLPVVIKVTPASTVIGRGSLIEISNVSRDEANDVLRCRFGPEARLHAALCVEDMEAKRKERKKIKKALAIVMLAMVTLAVSIAVKVATNANRLERITGWMPKFTAMKADGITVAPHFLV